MTHFNPFAKPLRQVTVDDLRAIAGIREGWHCDFKRSVERDLSKQAKYIASFANTYGGWLFYGVDQNRDAGESTAYSFPGIADADVEASLVLIRNAVAQHVAPPCYYEAHVVQGEGVSVGLPLGRSVICIHIPKGEAPPYIDRSGRVYRRVGDSSEPGSENDRTALDRLWAARRAKEESFREELRLHVSADARDTATAVLHLFVTETPTGETVVPRFMWNGFKEVMSTRVAKEEPTGIILPSVHRLPDGGVARGPEGTFDVRLPACRWRYRRDGLMVISLPFGARISGEWSTWEATEYLDGYENAERFADLLGKGAFTGRLSVVDMNILYPYILAVCSKLQRLGRAGGVTNWYLRARLDHASSLIPFLDSKRYLDNSSIWGLPFFDEDSYAFPADFSEPFRLEVGEASAAEDSPSKTAPYAFASDIFDALGVPSEAFDAVEVFAAGERARQRMRRIAGIEGSLE